MFLRARVIRCKYCKRLFSSYSDFCPDCLAKSSRGWISTVVPAFAIVIAIAVVIWTVVQLVNNYDKLQ